MEFNHNRDRSSSAAREIKSRRSWTPREEQALIIPFKDIISLGWKAENGFKTGFLNQLETRLRVSIPGTDLRAEPHIDSKNSSWKKTFFQILTALKYTGISYNHTTMTIEGTNEQWEGYLKLYPKHKGIRGKLFPYYPDWLDIYGKDRATGEEAMDWNTAANMEESESGGNEEEADASSMRAANMQENEATHSSAATPSNNKRCASSGSGKRKRTEQKDADLIEVISEFCKEANSSIREVAARLGSEIDAARRREALYDAIGKLPMIIPLEQKLEVCMAIGMNPKTVDMFFGVPEDAKMAMVRMAMNGKLPSL